VETSKPGYQPPGPMAPKAIAPVHSHFAIPRFAWLALRQSRQTTEGQCLRLTLPQAVTCGKATY